MVFSSVVFLFYFLPAILILYYTAGFLGMGLRNALLLLFSLLFYAWGEPRYVALLVGSCLINWLLALMLRRWERYKRFFLIVDCAANLGVLFLFKYLSFAVRTINGFNAAVGWKTVLPAVDILLPIGISFFTFQALSYVIDVYRGDAPAQKNPFYVALYISLFPQLVAGPIVRYRSVEKQLLHRRHTWEKFEEGAARFVRGLGKKLLLANTFAIVADNIYAMTMAGHQQMKVPVLLAWLGSFAYTLQIFYDFSGYSDMALGLGKMFGFTFDENFNYPYISKSIGEFWRRWHISLSSWFREYVYIPLGGSRVENADAMVRNLLIVWLLTGVWHGAAWTFIFWGLFQFTFILLERLFRYETMQLPGVWKHVIALVIINLGWVLFRSENFYQYREFMGNLFGLHQNGLYNSYVWMFLKEYAVFWAAGIIFCLPVGKWLERRLAAKLSGKPAICGKAAAVGSAALYPVCMLGLFFVCVIYLVKGGYNPFIYFNF